MLSKRIIAVILLRDGRAVKSRRFTDYRDVGDPVSQARIYYANGIDELCILNTQSEKGIQPLLDVLPAISQQCFIPVAAGGGVRSVDDAAKLIEAGCEKVVVRTSLSLIPDLADRFGSQSVVRCVDYDLEPTAVEHVCFDMGEGELLAQDTSRDGLMRGYDDIPIDTKAPLIRLGGCGSYQHMLDAFNAGADACAAGSLWAFTDSNPLRAKRWLRNHGVNVRVA